MKDRIIAKIKFPFCQLIKTKYQGYAVKTAVGTSYYSQRERPIAFKHFRNEMKHSEHIKRSRAGTPPNTSLVLSADELEFISQEYGGEKSRAIHDGLKLLRDKASH